MNSIQGVIHFGSKKAIDAVALKAGSIYFCSDGGIYYDISDSSRIELANLSYSKEEINNLLKNEVPGSGEGTTVTVEEILYNNDILVDVTNVKGALDALIDKVYGSDAPEEGTQIKLQYTEMPDPTTVAGIVQYVGETTQQFIKGYFYYSEGPGAEDGYPAEWIQLDVQPQREVDLSGLNTKFQYTEMPDPTTVAGLYQYIGETTELFTNGYFYYSAGLEDSVWVQVNVQPKEEFDTSDLNPKFQYTEMPEPELLTGMVQYLGETTDKYTFGYFYFSDGVAWRNVTIQPVSEDVDLSGLNPKFQYTEMPDPQLVKGIIQYLGETTEDYIKGCFYESTERSFIDENDETQYTYLWVRVDTQPQPEEVDLSGLNTKFQYTEMPDPTTMTGMVQYIGETDDNYTKGYFYYSAGLEDSVWELVKIQPDSEVDLSNVNSKFQYTEMPEPSPEIKGIIQYIGETNEEFTKGYFYECDTKYDINPETGETSSTSTWVLVDMTEEVDLSNVNSKFQYTEMPDPNTVTGIVQYIGITNEDYVHGYFYEPYTVDENTTIWSVVSIQPADKAADASSVYFTEAIPVTETIGGIAAGTVFDGSVNVQEVFKKLFYKYIPPKATLTLDPVHETYMTGITIENLNVSIKTYKTVDPIVSVEFSKTVEGGEPEVIFTVTAEENPSVANNGEYNEIIENISSDTTITVTVSDGKESNVVSKTIKFVDPIFWGVLGSNAVTDEIAKTYLTRELVTASSDTITVTATNEYVVYMTTKSVKSIVDGNGFNNKDSFVMNTVIVDGVSYNCYVSSTPITCTDFNYSFIF